MARTASYQGVVIGQDLPVGTEAEVCLKKDRKYFFTGSYRLPGSAVSAMAGRDE